MKWVLVFLVIILLLVGCESETGLAVGSEAHISVEGLSEVHLAVDREANDLWTDASIAKDYIGMAQLVDSGRVFPVPVGTKVLIIDSGFAIKKVRVLEGEEYGRSGWLPYEWVKQ